MPSQSNVIIPSIEESCTLKQACEYLAFGWAPRTPRNEELCRPDQYTRSKNYAFLSHGNAFRSPLITPDANRYNVGMSRALFLLYDLLQSGTITAIGIEDPALPDWTEADAALNNNIHKRLNYIPSEHTEYTMVILPEEWELDIIYNWIVTVPTKPFDQTSYRDIRINFESLKTAHPIKEHTITLTDDGRLCHDDGETTTVIYKLRPRGKRYEWLKFYIEHPYQLITEQDLANNFIDSRHEIRSTDKMCHCIFIAFEGHPELRAACFPIATTKEVYFRPTFNDMDIHPL